jgi:DNA-directed RNA polymerase subunit RPC12/RpoP
MSHSVTHLEDKLVKVNGETATRISDNCDAFIVSMNPVFNPSTLSEDGLKIAMNSMIDEELLGCPSCTRGRPLSIFGEHIGEFFVCRICGDSCPKCERGEISQGTDGISCERCDFSRVVEQ